MIQPSLFQTRTAFGQTAVTIRSTRPSDSEILVDLYGRLSDESLYKRFLRVYRPTVREIEQIVNMPTTQGAAVIATTEVNQREMAVGLAYYIVEDLTCPVSAEPAFVVDDWYQGQGIGTRLFNALHQTAVHHQIQTFNAYIHPANGGMMRVFEHTGLPLRQRHTYGERELNIRL